MESTTYVCYNQDDLAAQMKTYMDDVQNMKAALLKVAENDVNAGTLEEIKALLGMDANADASGESTASAPTSASAPSSDAKEPVSEPSATEDSATDTKEPETTISAPSTTESKPTEPNTVIVQAGDTLQTLAEKTGATPRHLIEANMLMEPVVLRPGQTLKY